MVTFEFDSCTVQKVVGSLKVPDKISTFFSDKREIYLFLVEVSDVHSDASVSDSARESQS